jgi:hypothetical protein
LEAVAAVREKQIDEARKTLEGLKKNKEFVTNRCDYYRDIEKVNEGERLHKDQLDVALLYQQLAQSMSIVASIAHAVPSFDIGTCGFGGSPKSTVTFGGPTSVTRCKPLLVGLLSRRTRKATWPIRH